VKVQQVAEDLGVRYVLEGSVQRSGDKVRVTAQLIDALKGHHLWAERYEREVKDAFTLQDDITLNVLTELEVELTAGESARIQRGNTNNLEAYQLVKRGTRLFRRFKKQSNAEARQLFEQAFKLDPNYAVALYLIGFTYQISAKNGWGEDPAQEQARAEELAHKALAIDPSGPRPYILLQNISLDRRRYDEAVGYAEKGVALAPNDATTLAQLGRTLTSAGRPEEALPVIQRAMRLSPRTPPNILRYEGEAYYAMGQYEKAIAAFERARARNPKGAPALIGLAMAYAELDRMDEARAAAQELLKVNPTFSAKVFANARDNKDRTIPERLFTALRKAELPK
jgi:adenylate cyclase